MYFPEPILFEVPVLPRVQKFLRIKLTSDDGQAQPLLAEPDALGPGLMLWAMAQSEKVHMYTNFSRKESHLRRRHDPAHLTGRIGIGIHEFHRSRSQYLLNAAELLVFSNMVDHMIRNELVQFCEAQPTIPPMVRIKTFCDLYDFSEEDYTEAGLKQMYLRHRRGTSTSGFAGQVSQLISFPSVSLAA